MPKTKRRGISESGTLQKLREQNKRLINEAESRKELVKIGEERARLAGQNKKLLKALRRSSTNVAARKILGVTGKGVFKAGKSIGKNLMRYGRFLEEAERKNQRQVKKIKKRKTKSRRKR